MSVPLIAVVGDTTPGRTYDPPMADPSKAKKAAEELGAELARRGARLLVYGGPYAEADVVRGFVDAKPSTDHSILMWYTEGNEPPPFPEEKSCPKLFERRAEKGADWEVAFYRSLTRADGVILIGGGNATKISGYTAIGSRLPLLALSSFGGGAKRVWEALSAGEDLPSRDDLNLMARPWGAESAKSCIDSLLGQRERRHQLEAAPQPLLIVLAAVLFALALAIVPAVWGNGAFKVWMLFLAPLVAGGAGAAIRPVVDRARGAPGARSAVLATVVVGLIAGGIAGVLFVTAQLTGDPDLTADAAKISSYAQRSIPYAVAVGFVAGLTAHAVFGKLLGLDVLHTTGIDKK